MGNIWKHLFVAILALAACFEPITRQAFAKDGKPVPTLY